MDGTSFNSFIKYPSLGNLLVSNSMRSFSNMKFISAALIKLFRPQKKGGTENWSFVSTVRFNLFVVLVKNWEYSSIARIIGFDVPEFIIEIL